MPRVDDDVANMQSTHGTHLDCRHSIALKRKVMVSGKRRSFCRLMSGSNTGTMPITESNSSRVMRRDMVTAASSAVSCTPTGKNSRNESTAEMPPARTTAAGCSLAIFCNACE